jgi:hypothetical protein
MTVAAAATSGSAGPVVPLPGQASDGGLGGGSTPPGLPSGRLVELKRERNTFRKQLERLQVARASLELPANELLRIDDERQALELQTAGAVSDWVSCGCEGVRPVSDAGRVSESAGKPLRLPLMRIVRRLAKSTSKRTQSGSGSRTSKAKST